MVRTAFLQNTDEGKSMTINIRKWNKTFLTIMSGKKYSCLKKNMSLWYLWRLQSSNNTGQNQLWHVGNTHNTHISWLIFHCPHSSCGERISVL